MRSYGIFLAVVIVASMSLGFVGGRMFGPIELLMSLVVTTVLWAFWQFIAPLFKSKTPAR